MVISPAKIAALCDDLRHWRDRIHSAIGNEALDRDSLAREVTEGSGGLVARLKLVENALPLANAIQEALQELERNSRARYFRMPNDRPTAAEVERRNQTRLAECRSHAAKVEQQVSNALEAVEQLRTDTKNGGESVREAGRIAWSLRFPFAVAARVLVEAAPGEVASIWYKDHGTIGNAFTGTDEVYDELDVSHQFYALTDEDLGLLRTLFPAYDPINPPWHQIEAKIVATGKVTPQSVRELTAPMVLEFLRECVAPPAKASRKPSKPAASQLAGQNETQPVDEVAETVKRVALLIGGDVAKIMAVVTHGAFTTDQKLRALCTLDERFKGYKSDDLADLLGVSPASIRNSSAWKEWNPKPTK
jgi:hypothetical protein